MTTINVPTRDEVSPPTRRSSTSSRRASATCRTCTRRSRIPSMRWAAYLTFQNAKSSITGKAREVVNLAVSQVNGCEYCLAAHTVIGKMHGFSDAQILEIRGGKASFDAKLDALAQLVQQHRHRARPCRPALVDAFFAAGWTKANLVDVIVAIGSLSARQPDCARTARLMQDAPLGAHRRTKEPTWRSSKDCVWIHPCGASATCPGRGDCRCWATRCRSSANACTARPSNGRASTARCSGSASARANSSWCRTRKWSPPCCAIAPTVSSAPTGSTPRRANWASAACSRPTARSGNASARWCCAAWIRPTSRPFIRRW